MNLIDRIKNVLITPKTEWEVIAGEDQSLSSLITSYVLPLALVGAACTFIGYGFIGSGYGIFRMFGLEWGIKLAVIQIISALAGVILTAFVVDMLAPTFGSEKNLNKSAQLVAYSYTASLIGFFFSIIPSIAFIGSLLGLYGIYLMYLGLGPIKKTPEDKKIVYLVVTIIILIVAYSIIGFILGSILGTSIMASNLLH